MMKLTSCRKPRQKKRESKTTLSHSLLMIHLPRTRREAERYTSNMPRFSEKAKKIRFSNFQEISHEKHIQGL